MGATLAHRGRDGGSRWLAGPVGFAHQRTWITPEETGEIQPIEGRTGVRLMLDGRLDNRDELLPALGLSQASSDASCALAAYEAWGEAFAERLNGDFAIAVFDGPRQQLVLARDPIGPRPLYFFHSGRLFGFGTEIKAVLAHPEVPVRPNEEGLADFLLLGSRPLDRQDVTCFEGVSALVPAHLLRVTAQGIRSRRYWDFDQARGIRLRSYEEYVEALRERFGDAVRRRIRSAHRVAVSLSGGLDSSSIFCQALRHARSSARAGAEVFGISYLGPAGSAADERVYLPDIEREHGVGIERFELASRIGFVRGIREQIAATEAPHFDYLCEAGVELRRRAVNRGARVLLVGHWGDQVMFSPAYLVDLFRGLAWARIRDHVREYARWFGPDETHVLWRRFLIDVARWYLPRRAVPAFKRLRRRVAGLDGRKPWYSDSFLARGLRDADRLATLGGPFHSAQAQSIYREVRSKYHVHCLDWHNKVSALSGLDTACPMMDRDLLAFVMAIPGEVQNRGGVPRGLLRDAMRGILPESIRTRRDKADFTSVVNAGVTRDVATIKRALTDDPLAVRLGYLDPRRLAPGLARLAAGLDVPGGTERWDLADLFGLETWLQVFLRSDTGSQESGG
jgi:asparagine synthase (glutamine-hydrolysing)